MTDQLRPSSSSSSSPSSPSSSMSSAPSLCTNHCGFYGNPKQDGMCSKCFKSIALKKAAEAEAASAVDIHSLSSSLSSPSDCSPSPASLSSSVSSASSATDVSVSSSDGVSEDIPIFRSSISVSSLPPLSFSDSINIPLTSPASSPLLSAAPTPSSPQPTSASATVDLTSPSSSSLSPPLSSLSLTSALSPSPTVLSLPAATVSTSPDKKRKNRCSHCNIKVGLTYFSCRCNESAMFCAAHRYPHSHQCVFDHRLQQQDKLTKANPVCAHDKLERI